MRTIRINIIASGFSRGRIISMCDKDIIEGIGSVRWIGLNKKTKHPLCRLYYEGPLKPFYRKGIDKVIIRDIEIKERDYLELEKYGIEDEDEDWIKEMDPWGV